MSFSGFVIDILLAFVIVIQVVLHTKRGFVKSLLLFIQAVVCFAIALLFYPVLGNAISDTLHLGITISNILAYVVIFIISFLISGIFISVIDRFFDLPVLNEINKILGFFLGLFFAFINLLFICSIVTGVLNILNSINPRISIEDIRQSTIIYKFISKFDIINLLILHI